MTEKNYTISSLAFQSTLPVRGATGTQTIIETNDFAFQSTLPVRGATCDNVYIAPKLRISIHAPRAGSDSAAGDGAG